MSNETFQELLTVHWERVLSGEKDIIELFKILKIECLSNIQILSRTPLPNDRLSVMIGASDINGQSIRIIIDATSGVPTWEQFINVTYDQGKDTDLKIILYDKGYEYDDIDADTACLTEIANLVRRNNKCLVSTYLAGGITFDHNGQRILEVGSVWEYPNKEAIDDSWTLPSKRQVQESEFWVDYYYPHWKRQGALPIGINDDLISYWNPDHLLGSNIKTRVYWNDEGFLFNVTGESGSEEIQWIWANRKSHFEDEYPGCSISLKEDGESACVFRRNPPLDSD